MKAFVIFLALAASIANATSARRGHNVSPKEAPNADFEGRGHKLPLKESSEHVHSCDIQEGEPCEPKDCFHCGYCWELTSHYLRCHRHVPDDPKLPITGNWSLESCDDNLWWNPDLKPKDTDVGGACDLWSNLSDAVKEGYLKDKNCVDISPLCKWGQDEGVTCSPNYWYWDPETMTEGEKEVLSCSEGLFWDQATETCREPENVAGCAAASP